MTRVVCDTCLAGTDSDWAVEAVRGRRAGKCVCGGRLRIERSPAIPKGRRVLYRRRKTVRRGVVVGGEQRPDRVVLFVRGDNDKEVEVLRDRVKVLRGRQTKIAA